MTVETRSPKVVERRLRGAVCLFWIDQVTPDGKRRRTLQRGQRGELVTLPLDEAARLDALGMLAEPGQSAEDIEADLEAAQDSYRAARQHAIGGAE